MEIRTYTITEETGRIDKVLALGLDVSRAQVQKWIKESRVFINQNPIKSNYKVKIGDEIRVEIPEEKTLDLIAQDIPLNILYEDEDVVVVNKPQGMVVHPSPGHPEGTLVNALLYHIKDLSSINDVIRPGIVHRIDKDTSGLLMIAKNDQAHEYLAKQLSEKTSQREYLAIVHGDISHEKGTIDAPIGRDPKDRKKQAVITNGKHAVTHFTVLERFGNYTLVSCKLETGRTHQIRVHMNYIGHPVAGDPLYAPRKTLKGHGQFLHARTLGFEHPTTHEWMQFETDVPEIFNHTLEMLRS